MITVADMSGSWEGVPEAALADHPALARVREHVGCLGGRITIRSGTARLVGGSALKEAGPMLESDLAPVPGAQISILLPGRRRALSPEV